MSDLIGNPKDRFSCNTAHFIIAIDGSGGEFQNFGTEQIKAFQHKGPQRYGPSSPTLCRGKSGFKTYMMMMMSFRTQLISLNILMLDNSKRT